jgi:hypothetical protein
MAARELVERVQSIVIEAKEKKLDWKERLLQLLGETSTAEEQEETVETPMKVLLTHCKSLPTFAARCIEQELPPNLIHCLRLLRVLELKNTDTETPAAFKATRNTSRLLMALCTTAQTGEQLQSHLFGLLALSGASYPETGLAVAMAASSVIIALAQYCWTPQIVWYIHDRKMIFHMTDDIKDLMQLSTAASASASTSSNASVGDGGSIVSNGSSVANGLVGSAAEKAGMWSMALKTLVSLVHYSTQYGSTSLVEDFVAAGGLAVLKTALEQSTAPHGRELVELIPLLVCCGYRVEQTNLDEIVPHRTQQAYDLKLVQHPLALELFQTLLQETNPLFDENETVQSFVFPDAFSALTSRSLTRAQSADFQSKYAFDLQGEFISILLRLFADHPDNYELLEESYHALTFSVLALPCLSLDTKNLVLKALEFVLTGVGVKEQLSPVHACVEIFMALIHGIVTEKDDKWIDDAALIASTLEKWLQFDQRVAPLLLQSGLMTAKLESLLGWLEPQVDSSESSLHVATALDIVCRVFRLLVLHLPPPEPAVRHPLHKLVELTILRGWSLDACLAVAGVLENYLMVHPQDLVYIFDLVKMIEKSQSEKSVLLWNMIRNVLEVAGKDLFRECGGFEKLLECKTAPLNTLLSVVEAALGLSKSVSNSTGKKDGLYWQPSWVDPYSSQLVPWSDVTRNRCHLLQTDFYFKVAELFNEEYEKSLDSAFQHVGRDKDTIRNPDAIRLVIALVNTRPPPATTAVGAVQQLFEWTNSPTLLQQLACMGLIHFLSDGEWWQPIRLRLASYRLSLTDFVDLLRSHAGPLLQQQDRIKVPIVSGSSRRNIVDEFDEGHVVACLQTLVEAARASSQAISSVMLGGDSINSLAVLKHDVPLVDRLRAVAEEGRLHYMEMDALSSAEENVESTLNSSGFSYSLWFRHSSDFTKAQGNLYVLDVASSLPAESTAATPATHQVSYLTVWYDVSDQRFNVCTSARGESIGFPVTPLAPFVWHHLMLTYSPAKRSMMSRKSTVSLYINGRSLEAEVRVDAVTFPSKSKISVGVPNPTLAVSGIVRGRMPTWEAGNLLLLTTVLLDYDATAIYCYGPHFPGLLWGDRPQRTSLAATATSSFAQFSLNQEPGSLASALRRRDIVKMERAGYSKHSDELQSLHLYCQIPPEVLLAAFQPGTALRTNHRIMQHRLYNLAALSGSESVASDAILVGLSPTMVRHPSWFADALWQAGGPDLLVPLIHAAPSSAILEQCLALMRFAVRGHIPNLSRLQSAGGYRVLGVLLQEKHAVDVNCMDQCLAFAIFDYFQEGNWTSWILQDLDAMKHLLLNHKVWDLRKYGPEVPLRLLRALNLLVDHRSIHKASNARRLHQVGIVRWTIHLMIEAAELYMNDKDKAWVCDSPLVTEITVGGDPGNMFLLECKSLLRRVLTFMLTPGDLGALAEASIYTVSIAKNNAPRDKAANDIYMQPSSIMRLHLVRLMEELIVDGVNEIVASHTMNTGKADRGRDAVFQPHSGGVASPGQPYFSTPNRRGIQPDGVTLHPKHQQAQAFLAAFSGFLTPVWFATLLEGGREEASVAATFRLMILLLQGSSSFESSFQQAGGFTPFVLSVPRYSTSPGLAIAMLSQLLNVPILHLHSLPYLDPDQLCELFDAEGDAHTEIPVDEDPSAGIFALLAECLGRNIKISYDETSDLSVRATDTNQAIFQLLLHRFEVSPNFREFCAKSSFCVPLSQTLCSILGSKLPVKVSSTLAEAPQGPSKPSEMFVGNNQDKHAQGMGLVRLLRRILLSSIKDIPLSAATTVRTLFRSFPIHATPDQAQALHLILLENCAFSMEKVLEEGDAIAVANCVGIGSVLLELVVQGFFSGQALLQAFQITAGVLDKLVKFETKSVHSLSNAEHSFMTQDASHITQAMVAVALQQSAIARPYLRMGDEDLQSALLQELTERVDIVLLVPSNDRRHARRIPTHKFPRPAPGNKIYRLWLSTSVARVIETRLYPDLASSEHPDLAVLAPLLVVVYQLLVDGRDDVRGMCITILVRLLKHREKAMTELLVAQFQQSDGTVERVDIVTRGGFRALLLAYEEGGTPQSLQRRYASFFEWLDRQGEQVDVVFDSVQRVSNDMFPALSRYSTSSQSPIYAIEAEQKRMLLKLTAEDSDRTIIGGLERSELSRHCNERTLERHNRWKRQGFDDLAYGAMALKILLRRLKGPFSVWEGNQLPFEDVKHWKLDMTEGHERQRRRLLPNYEFHDLYNLDETNLEDSPVAELDIEEVADESIIEERVVALEATAELLKDLKLKRAQHRDVEDDLEEFNEDAAEDVTIATTATAASSMDGSALADAETNEKPAESKEEVSDEESEKEGPSNDDSYELVIGLLRKGDWPLKSYNCRRCIGLEVMQALFLFCQDAVYIIDGFEQINGEKISRVEREKSSYHVSLRPKDFKATEEEDAEKGGIVKSISSAKTREKDTKRHPGDLTAEVLHQHRSQRIEFSQLYSVLRRRYQLQQSGLEFFDIHKNATLIAFDNNSDREEVLTKILSSQLHPDSIFSVYGSSNYVKTISNYKQRIISQWIKGQMTNFDFLMHLNSLAGRSFNDLTQYPVFPWIIADYDSEEIDLHDPKTYRDLSKNMGSLGEERAQQFRERYEALESTYFGDDDPPPFHFGTHFSSAAYTLYYLMRLEPFSRLALALQGGRFDVADRLFHDIGRSWKSASAENLQDVRELIPEFFYLPDFLTNTNGFDFGVTQKGKSVHDVTLPKWAKGDPERFVRINRQALESTYVSQHLHLWVDLVFGYKQRSVEDLNVFVHVTYEGEVDLESMTDPIQRASTIAQIQNFGQTPSRLERRPFPARQVVSVVRDSMIDFSVLPQLALMTPPLCVMGAPHLVKLSMTHSETVRLGLFGQVDRTVGDLFLVKGQVMGVGRMCTVMMAQKKYIRYGGLTNGISIYNCAAPNRQREGGNLLSLHDGLHRMPISAAKASVRGDWMVTGSLDSTIRVWQLASDKLHYQAVLSGNDGYPITCLDLSTEFSIIVSGSERGRVIVWDLRSLSFVRHLPTLEGKPVHSVSINNKNGNVLSLSGSQLLLTTINGKVLGERKSFTSPPTYAVATDCPEWMEMGVVAVTGHACGNVCLWSLDIQTCDFILRHTLEESPHKNAITCVRVAGDTRQDHVLVGDSSGRMSCWKVLQLEMADTNELEVITEQIINDRPYI